jgi:hypothetical protein
MAKAILVLRVRRSGHCRYSSAGARRALLAIALLYCGCACAETRVYLVRGWFGVFSAGIDAMAEELRGQGIRAEAIGHLSWQSTAAKIVKDRAAGAPGPLVLIGHSQGANNAIDMARALQTHGIRVDLLVTLAPFLQDPVPSNVVRAVNYYQSPGWGTPLAGDRGFKGEIANVDIGDVGTFHVNIDKNEKVQAEIVAAIAALRR